MQLLEFEQNCFSIVMTTESTSKLAKGAAAFKSKLLPPNYVLGEYDVICGRGSTCFNHIGNRRFRKLVAAHLDRYSMAKSKVSKNTILCDIVQYVRSKSPNGGFVKKNRSTGRFVEVGDFQAREKTSQAFRDALHDKYKSSNSMKRNRRLLMKGVSETDLTNLAPTNVPYASEYGMDDNSTVSIDVEEVVSKEAEKSSLEPLSVSSSEFSGSLHKSSTQNIRILKTNSKNKLNVKRIKVENKKYSAESLFVSPLNKITPNCDDNKLFVDDTKTIHNNTEDLTQSSQSNEPKRKEVLSIRNNTDSMVGRSIATQDSELCSDLVQQLEQRRRRFSLMHNDRAIGSSGIFDACSSSASHLNQSSLQMYPPQRTIDNHRNRALVNSRFENTVNTAVTNDLWNQNNFEGYNGRRSSIGLDSCSNLSNLFGTSGPESTLSSNLQMQNEFGAGRRPSITFSPLLQRSQVECTSRRSSLAFSSLFNATFNTSFNNSSSDFDLDLDTSINNYTNAMYNNLNVHHDTASDHYRIESIHHRQQRLDASVAQHDVSQSNNNRKNNANSIDDENLFGRLVRVMENNSMLSGTNQIQQFDPVPIESIISSHHHYQHMNRL